MSPKLINGKVWIRVESVFGGGYQKLPENDTKYEEILLWIDSQRFVELLDWVYNQRTPKKVVYPHA
jgi:chromate transport protein ChrA